MDEESDVFKMRRGTKQVVLLSKLLLNTTLQFALECDVKNGKKGQAFARKNEDYLTNRRLAPRYFIPQR